MLARRGEAGGTGGQQTTTKSKGCACEACREGPTVFIKCSHSALDMKPWYTYARGAHATISTFSGCESGERRN